MSAQNLGWQLLAPETKQINAGKINTPKRQRGDFSLPGFFKL